MAVDDEHERDLAQLPRRARPTTTRTDARSLPREATTITRPLFTADESAESAADGDIDDDEGDLFDAPQATTADTPLLSDATEFNVERPQLTALNVDDDDSSDDEPDSAAVERTIVSLVLPDHLREARDDSVDEDSDDSDDGADGAPTQFEPRGSMQGDAPPHEVTQSNYVYATKPPEGRPAWQMVAMAVAAVVVLAVFVVVVVAAFAAPAAAPPAP